MSVREIFAWIRILATDFFDQPALVMLASKNIIERFIASSLVVGLKIECVFELPFSSTRLPY